jgi:hypothetical protein
MIASGALSNSRLNPNQMKKNFYRVLILCLFFPFTTIGQITDENKSVTDLVLNELNKERMVQRENLDFRIKQIDSS